jgi:hypothetical protein
MMRAEAVPAYQVVVEEVNRRDPTAHLRVEVSSSDGHHAVNDMWAARMVRDLDGNGWRHDAPAMQMLQARYGFAAVMVLSSCAVISSSWSYIAIAWRDIVIVAMIPVLIAPQVPPAHYGRVNGMRA